jgi:hypothetical protein
MKMGLPETLVSRHLASWSQLLCSSFDGILDIVNKSLLIIIDTINPVDIFIYNGPLEEY